MRCRFIAVVVPADLRYAHARARRSGAGSLGRLGHTWTRALDLKPIMRCQRGETREVGKVRGFAAAADRVLANVRREIERGLVVPFVNLSCGGDWTGITRRSAYQAMAQAASSRGVDVHWSHLSMTAGIDLGPGALTVGIVAQPHEFFRPMQKAFVSSAHGGTSSWRLLHRMGFTRAPGGGGASGEQGPRLDGDATHGEPRQRGRHSERRITRIVQRDRGPSAPAGKSTKLRYGKER